MTNENKFLGITVAPDLSRKNFIGVFLNSALLLLAYMIPTIALPRFLKETIGIGDANFGTINSAIQIIGSLTVVIFVGFVGSLSDRYGRKILLFYGMLASAAAFLLYSLPLSASTFTGLPAIYFVFLFHFILAISMTFAFPQPMIITADYTDFKSRGKAMAISASMMGIGVTFSFFIFSAVQKIYGVYSLFLAGAGICLISLIVTKFMVIDRKLPHHEGRGSERQSTLQSLKDVLAELKINKGLRFCIVSTFPASSDRIILGIFIMIWAVESAPDFGYTRAQATAMGGIVVGLSSICALAFTPVMGILVDRIGRRPILISGLALKGLGFLLLGLTSNPFSIAVKLCGIVTGLGVAAVSVSSSTLTADLAPKKILGSVMTTASIAGSLGTLFFVQCGGIIFDHVSHSSPFILVGAADILALLYGLIVWTHVPKINRHAEYKERT